MFCKRSLVILCAAIAASTSAHAAFTFELQEVGSDVVLTGSGSVNLGALTYYVEGSSIGGLVIPSEPFFQVGAKGAPLDIYKWVLAPTGPASFGAGSYTSSLAAAGSAIGFGDNNVNVPKGYISGTQLSGSATFANSTFASLGITPGSYTWSWGSGATADSVTLTAAVPEPSTYAMALAGLGILGVWARRQKRISQRSAEAAAA